MEGTVGLACNAVSLSATSLDASRQVTAKTIWFGMTESEVLNCFEQFLSVT